MNGFTKQIENAFNHIASFFLGTDLTEMDRTLRIVCLTVLTATIVLLAIIEPYW